MNGADIIKIATSRFFINKITSVHLIEKLMHDSTMIYKMTVNLYNNTLQGYLT
jgi:hypothetical protein